MVGSFEATAGFQDSDIFQKAIKMMFRRIFWFDFSPFRIQTFNPVLPMHWQSLFATEWSTRYHWQSLFAKWSSRYDHCQSGELSTTDSQVEPSVASVIDDAFQPGTALLIIPLYHVEAVGGADNHWKRALSVWSLSLIHI